MTELQFTDFMHHIYTSANCLNISGVLFRIKEYKISRRPKYRNVSNVSGDGMELPVLNVDTYTISCYVVLESVHFGGGDFVGSPSHMIIDGDTSVVSTMIKAAFNG